MHAQEVLDQYVADPAVFHHKAVLINVNRSALEGSLYEATRYGQPVGERLQRELQRQARGRAVERGDLASPSERPIEPSVIC